MSNDIVKPSILPGFMELLPSDQLLFNSMMDTIKKNYERCGFIPLDTPVIEKSEVLLAKGGGETEKQIYRFSKGDSDLSLRFDLTVPLARYVSQYFSSLSFPFRRYHIGKVYRGERNQKGRFREFYQCDIDIIGNNKLSVINDAEIPSIIYSTFKDLGFDSFTIRINNRKVLNGFFESLGIEDKMGMLHTLDKIEKIGEENVRTELREQNVSDEAIDKVLSFIKTDGTKEEILDALRNMGIENEEFKLGVEELSDVVRYIRCFGVPDENFKLDLTISRGLDYYTGTVYETFLDDYPKIGSVCSGGRYENLAGHYTKEKLPGVGISIGLTRLFYQLREAKIVKDNPSSTNTEVLIIPMKGYEEQAIRLAASFRESGVVAETYFEDGKMGKKFTYANKLGIPYTAVIGETEAQTGTMSLKNMTTSEQVTASLDEALSIVKNRK